MTDISYFQSRMEQLGISDPSNDPKNKIWVNNPDAEHPMPSRYETNIFSEDKDGNINILYWRLNGDLISYVHMGDGKMSHVNGKLRHYVSKRLKVPKGDMKYQNPKGQGAPPWFPPMLVKAYANKEVVKTLFLTEGVFKSYLAALWGMPVVGLSSISTYRDPKTNMLHSDIISFIEVCQVERVVILWDGDCRDISEKALLRREELTGRPTNFYGAAKAIKRLVEKIKFEKNREAPRVVFMHCKPDSMPGKPKGLDDMLIAAESDEQRKSIVAEAMKMRSKDFYFYKKDITKSTASLFKYFMLKNYEDFYTFHQEQIESTEFMFRGDVVRWDDHKEELVMMAPAYAKEIRWIGDEFFKDIVVPGAKQDRRKLDKRSKATLVDLHGKNFIQYLEYYEGFCNVPSHLNYEQVVERYGKKYYNRYFPFVHKEEKGNCNTILNFYKHIFGDEEMEHAETGKKYKMWELGLDYTQNLLLEPTQNLPVLILYSPENATGKSTFGYLHQMLFTDNVIQIGNADLQSDFNETYTDKLLAICEETLLERKKDAERIKAITTAEQVLVNPKGQRQYSIDFFCKFMLFSNNLRMIYANRHDERYWIIQTHPSEKRDPKLKEKMKSEIPAFIHFLKNRKLTTEQEGRMWFHPSLTRTSVFDDVVRVNEPGGASDIRDGISDMFIQNPETKEIHLTLKDVIREFLPPSTTKKWAREVLKDHLQVDLERNKAGQAVSRRGRYQKFERNHDGIELKEIATRGNHYIFKREMFLDDANVDFTKFDETDEPTSITPSKMKFNTAGLPAEETEAPF